jgi:hypothetical protein
LNSRLSLLCRSGYLNDLSSFSNLPNTLATPEHFDHSLTQEIFYQKAKLLHELYGKIARQENHGLFGQPFEEVDDLIR